MTGKSAHTLSASLEDYLEVILWSVAATGAARVRDIAAQLQVQASSVTGALRLLAERRFIHYRPYEAITLTPEGFEEATRIVQRHRILSEFFTEVLGIPAEAADEGACQLEHGISSEIVHRLGQFVEHVKSLPEHDRDLLTGFAARAAESRSAGGRAAMSLGCSTVADMKPGRKAVIVRVGSHGGLARRLADMGIGRGVLLEVESIAPMGGTVRIRIRGYRLALRRSEAQTIVVIEK